MVLISLCHFPPCYTLFILLCAGTSHANALRARNYRARVAVGMFIHAIKVECRSAYVNTAPITNLRAYVTAQTYMNRVYHFTFEIAKPYLTRNASSAKQGIFSGPIFSRPHHLYSHVCFHFLSSFIHQTVNSPSIRLVHAWKI